MICRGFYKRMITQGGADAQPRSPGKNSSCVWKHHEGMEKNTAEESWVERAVRKGLLARAEDGGFIRKELSAGRKWLR